MDCPRCGAAVRGNSYCESCGTLVRTASYASAKVAPMAEGANPGKRTFVAPIVIAAVAIALVVGAVLGYRHFFAGDILHYDDDLRAECSSTTRLVPYDAFGDALTQYSVEIIATGGQEEEIEGELPSIKVSGNAGFSISNFGAIPDGGYLLRVSDSQMRATYEFEVWHDADSVEAKDEYQIKHG